MKRYIVTFTSPVVEADGEEQAIEKATQLLAEGEWEATPVPEEQDAPDEPSDPYLWESGT
jgi:hypothetical protein